MDVDELPLRRMFEQFVEQRRAFRLGQAADVARMVAEIERFSRGIGMGAHQRMAHRWPIGVECRAKDHPQSGDPALRLLRQRVIGERRVGELGVAGGGRHLDGEERRQ